ncbi:hypothetical protein ACO1O0_007221 [Amphichorda felina]
MLPPATDNYGIFQDTIAGLSEPLSSLNSLSPLVSLLALAYQTETPSPSCQDRLSSLMYTLAPSPADHYSHEELRCSFTRLLRPVLSGMTGLREFQEAVGASSDPGGFRDFWRLQGRNLIRDLVQFVGNPDGGDEASPGADVPFLDAFVADLGCRVALGLDRGQLILVPGEAKAGDDVRLRLVLHHDRAMAFRELSLT